MIMKKELKIARSSSFNKHFVLKTAFHILLFLFLIGKSLQAKLGCIDNSFHHDVTKRPDFKTYHYVSCTCPCDRYAQFDARSRCTKCKHFHAPGRPIYIN